MVAFGFRNIDIDDPFSCASPGGRAVHVLGPDLLDPGSNPGEQCHSSVSDLIGSGATVG